MNKEKSFRSTRAKKLKLLEEYAEFENLRGKVNITKIIKPIYTKGSKNYELIKEKTKEQWSDTGLDTCKLVADKIREKYNDKLNVADSTLYTYTCNSRRELWGKPFGNKFCSEGELGYCEYEMCKEINGQCIEFTEEEKKIKDEVLSKYYGNNVSEKILFINEMLEDGEITEEEFLQEIKRITDVRNKYMNYKKELEERIGSKITKATRVTNNAIKIKYSTEPFVF